MTWTDLTFPSGSKLTSTKMTQVQSNFSALAGGEPGAPPISVNSLMWSGVASGAFLHVSSGMQTTGVGSFGVLDVSSGLQVRGAGSFGTVSADSGFHATGVGSFGALDVSSGMRTTGVGSFGSMDVSSAIAIRGAAASPPAANTLYKDNIPKGWISLDGTGTIAILSSFNVASVTDNGIGDYMVTWDTDFADGNYAVTAVGKWTGGFGFACWIDSAVGNPLAGSVRIAVGGNTTAKGDTDYLHLIAFGDQ